MKSKNNLTLSGYVGTVFVNRQKTQGRFTLAHYFGGHSKPALYMDCVLQKKLLMVVPRRGDFVTIDAYLKPSNRGGTEAHIKRLNILETKKGLYVVQQKTGDEFFVPQNQCNPDLFSISNNILVLPTAFGVVFEDEDAAWKALCTIKRFIKESGVHTDGVIMI